MWFCLRWGLKQSPVDHETSIIACHVGFHVGFVSIQLPWSARPSSCSVKPSLQFWHSPPMRYFRIQRSLALKLYYEVPLSALGWTSVSYGWRRNHRKLQKIHGCHSEAPGWLPCKSTCLLRGSRQRAIPDKHTLALSCCCIFLFVCRLFSYWNTLSYCFGSRHL